MLQCWRWFGAQDPVKVGTLRQIGVEGVVSALHHIPNGEVWPYEDIVAHQQRIAYASDGSPTGVTWQVVESLAVSEEIKTKGAAHGAHIDAYKQSLQNLARAGIKVVCYNFMPVIDWTRTKMRALMSNGGQAMLFDLPDFVAFDAHILQRPGAGDDYSPEMLSLAAQRFRGMSDADKDVLQKNIIAGLPGANDGWTLEQVRAQLARYDQIDAESLRQNLIDFLAEVAPVAERLGVRLCCHPDDPPFPLLGLPRVMSTAEDYAKILGAIDSLANGVTFCTGSFGVDPDFDAVGFIKRHGARIHFAHLRNTRHLGDADRGRHSFCESEHLNGDTDMVGVVAALVAEEARRKAEGRADWQIPMRPDHGQDLLFDQEIAGMPGYPLIGRMRGLAELRGVMAAFEYS